MTEHDDCARRHEVAALRREVRELRAQIVRFSRRRQDYDSRLPVVLAMIHRFALAKPWTVGELLEDARRGDRELWCALDGVVGDRGNAAIRLGRWLQRHEGVEVEGLRLERITHESGSWLYRVVGESWELDG